MDETHKLAAIVAPISWICGLIGWLILFFTLNKSIRSAWSISYVIGIMTALLNLGLMVKGSKHIQKNALNPYNKSVKVNVLYYILRIILFTAIYILLSQDALRSSWLSLCSQQDHALLILSYQMA